MKIEVRANGIHISGYVNVTGKKSHPVITPHGKCIEVIEERAFEKALARNGDVKVSVDHEEGYAYASTRDGTAKLYEDAIGLHADILISDSLVIEMAKKGKIKGWSFGMYNVVDEMEQRAEGELPIRHVKELDIDHITLVVNKTPCYAATSVECRADETVDIEQRSLDIEPELHISDEHKHDYTTYEERIEKL